MIDQTILQYKILEKLGEGGMGEVYKAQDTKLDRLVALKFLPSSTTATEADKARFIQEAKAASALNHTNVCTIYDIQEYEDPQGTKKLFIVMEFVDGETLRAKKNLSVKQVLEIGAQAAEGLAAAHEKGIVHRDIKPENIMLRKDGRVQIMDFGLAKLYAGTEASRLTKAGTTMGTVGYMSPEQVQGQDVDHRTDIFSLGVVLYELLAGESPFKGVHETAIIYEIVNVDPPPIATVKADISPELDQLILECLEKEKDERFQSAKELARGLRKLKRGSTGSRASKMFSAGTATIKTGAQRDTATNLSGPLVYEDVPLKKLVRNVVYNRPILWATIGLFFLSTAFLFFLFLSKKSAGNSTGAMSFAASLEPPPGKQFTFTANGFEGVHLAVSPDGSMLAFVGQDSAGKQSLWVRQLNSLSAQELNGTEGAYFPFWSYDSKYIGYFAGGSLKKILASGGPSVTICKATDARGGSWNQNDMIVFEPEEATGIFAVSASGGEPKEITKLDSAKGERTQRWPCFLPDGQHFIFYSRVPGTSTQDLDAIYAASLDGKEVRRLFTSHSNAVYADKNILYVQDQTLMAQPFDPDNLKLTGAAVPIEEHVRFSQTYNCGIFAASRNGVLVYQGGNTTNGERFSWYSRDGKQEKTFGKPDDYRQADLSPDGTRIAVTIYDNNGRNFDIWLYDINRKIYSRFTFSPSPDRYPLWSHDGKWVAFASDREKGGTDLFMKSASGLGNPIQLTFTGRFKAAVGWSPDNKELSYAQLNSDTKADVYLVAVPQRPDTEIAKPMTLLNSQFDEVGMSFSPDDKWAVYTTNESGQYQLYVSPFPNMLAGKWQLSGNPINGNTICIWSMNGRGVYYVSAANKVMYTEVNPHGSEFEIGKTIALFDIPYGGKAQFVGMTKDEQRFLFIVPVQNGEESPLTLVTNWERKLKQGKD